MNTFPTKKTRKRTEYIKRKPKETRNEDNPGIHEVQNFKKNPTKSGTYF